jgi:hypothetical protein
MWYKVDLLEDEIIFVKIGRKRIINGTITKKGRDNGRVFFGLVKIFNVPRSVEKGRLTQTTGRQSERGQLHKIGPLSLGWPSSK